MFTAALEDRVGVREPRSGTCLTLGDRCSAG